jgi:tryptophanyl-tRNA synthetase
MKTAAGRAVVLSGIQPSGHLTLGNYLGALKNWVALQEQYDCYYTLVDLHTITVRQEPESLRERCYKTLALLMACGLDPQRNVLFVQSHVGAHARLAWILNCYTMVGELNRMTQFKDKTQKQKSDSISAGLFDYPVLMAADILLYDTAKVPVGEDQKQHLELARDVAIRFNNVYGPVFRVPEPMIPQIGARIMGLQDPTAKMSKSDESENNNVYLLDPPEAIERKFKRAVTDSGSEVRYSADKPGVANLMSILSATTGEPFEAIEHRFSGQGYGKFKAAVAGAVVEALKPVQRRYREIRDDEAGLRRVLKDGAARAAAHADRTLARVHDVLGFIPE